MDELEHALLEHWDRETLLVYADALLARGDPRGELIALDLEAERGITAELAQRRRKALYAWLGGSTIRGRPIHEGSFRFGFVTDFYVTTDRASTALDYLRALFESAAGPFVRGLTFALQTPAELEALLPDLAAAPRRWLERIELRIVTPGGPVGDRLIPPVIEATPRLHTLIVHGAEALRTFAHPAVRRVVTDTERIPLVHGIPNLETLDLLFQQDCDETIVAQSIAALRELRHLDLSRNEPWEQWDTPPVTDVYRFARWLPPRLQTLRLPSLRTAHQVAVLAEILDATTLEVTVARTYTAHGPVFAGLRHPRLHLPTPFIWPPTGTMSSREALTITAPTEEHGDDLGLKRLIDLLEAQWDHLPQQARAAWLAFWDLLADLPWDDEEGHEITKSFAASTLLTAVEPLDDYVRYSGSPGHWAQLAEKLRAAELPPEAAVSVRRYWGW